jgi:hypothetical protein
MQYQVQERRDEQKTQDELDLYVSLRSGLDDPYNVFVKVSDLEENRPLIYFYAYSLGKKKVVVWGVFDRNKNEFLIDDACQYGVNDLKSILNSWKEDNYNFFFSSVRDRIDSRMRQNNIFKDRNFELNLMAKFRQYFLQKLIQTGHLRGKIDKDFLESEYESLLATVAREAIAAILDRRDYDSSIRLLADEIDSMEDEKIVLEALDRKNIKNLSMSRHTPHIQNIIKYILVNVFILVFLEMEEYRVAKYIDYLSKNKNKGEETNIRNYLKGKFLYEWIYELAKIFRIENIRLFMKKYAEDILRLTENQINLTDIGVIGNRDMKSYKVIEDMALFFEEFISKSKYSKITYTNSLPLCPKVFIERPSKYDFT